MFPRPFTGCTQQIRFKDQDELSRAVKHLVDEKNHFHNFVVSVENLDLYVSTAAVFCLHEKGLIPE